MPPNIKCHLLYVNWTMFIPIFLLTWKLAGFKQKVLSPELFNTSRGKYHEKRAGILIFCIISAVKINKKNPPIHFHNRLSWTGSWKGAGAFRSWILDKGRLQPDLITSQLLGNKDVLYYSIYSSFYLKPKYLQSTTKAKELTLPIQYFLEGTVTEDKTLFRSYQSHSNLC